MRQRDALNLCDSKVVLLYKMWALIFFNDLHHVVTQVSYSEEHKNLLVILDEWMDEWRVCVHKLILKVGMRVSAVALRSVCPPHPPLCANDEARIVFTACE